MSLRELDLPTPGAALDSTSAVLRGADGSRRPILLAHGAGAALDAPFLVHVAEGLAAGEHPVLTFNYTYAERMRREDKRRPPDRRPALELVHRAALAWLEEHYGTRPVLAGKSLGGRIASYLAAAGAGAALVFYGYPLHPANQRERTRAEHFPALTQPALFLQGTRDALCERELLLEHLETYGGTATVHWIEEADHDFALPKRTGRVREQVLDELVETSLAWLAQVDRH